MRRSALLLAVLAAACAREPGAAPSLNRSWLGDDVEPLVARLESESREIWVHRQRLADAVAPAAGADVADVGAGSGFMVFEFAERVGLEGTVWAVDVNPVMMEHVAAEAKARGVPNVRTVVCTQESVELPPRSVDLVFICDTYHHFEQPASTMRTIHEALRPGGELVLVEFEREPGRSREWVLEHVRGGRDAFVEEITGFGFELVAEHDLPELRETYVLRFRKK